MRGTTLNNMVHIHKAIRLFACCHLCPLLVMLVASCAPKHVEIPTFEGVDPREELARKGAIQGINATFEIAFERDGSLMKGDAVLRLTHEELDLQVYSLGFLVAEVSADHRMTRSTPPLDRSRMSLLVDGIRSSFFWWSVKYPDINESEDEYRISNSWRKLYIHKRTFMPLRQIIELDNGRQLHVAYDEPVFMDGMWFPSGMRIELSGHVVTLRIKSVGFKSAGQDL